MPTSHHMRAGFEGANHGGAVLIMLPPSIPPKKNALSPTAMAQYLRETTPLNARCFALEMQEQVAWANEAWGEFWGDVASLV